MTDQNDTRTAALILEVELPDYYAEDLRPDSENWQDWLKTVDVDPTDIEAVGREILHNIGEVHCGLLTIEVSGEKDSEIVRVPVSMVGARVEDRPPDTQTENAQHLAERVDEPHDEERVLGAMHRAEARVLEKFVRQIASEYTGGSLADLAKQALQEAKLASDEAEKRESDRGRIF